MKRREILAGFTALPLISGCSTLTAIDESDETDTMTDSTMTEQPFKLISSKNGVSIETTQSLSTIQGHLEVGLVEDTPTDGPIQIGGVYTNTSGQTQQLSFGSDAPLTPMSDSSNEVHLRSLQYEPVRESDCWRSDTDGWLSDRLVAKVAPSESASTRLQLLYAGESGMCFPDNLYEFEQPVNLLQDDTDISDSIQFRVNIE